ncbi:MAG: hypothetical protein HYS57_03185 [Parcubacteria group bacterium]|nr:hypothetical protein [Parcubacteria group bacterium]
MQFQANKIIAVVVVSVAALGGGVFWYLREMNIGNVGTVVLSTPTPYVSPAPPQTPTPLFSSTPLPSPTPVPSVTKVENNCFAAAKLSPPVDTTGWWIVTNYQSGFVLIRASTTQVLREPDKESRGLEVFRVTSPLFLGGASLKAYDLRVKLYSTQAPDGTAVSYDVGLDTWQKAGAGGGDALSRCTPNAAGQTSGKWPIYKLQEKSDQRFSYTYIVVHPTKSQTERFPVAVELSIRGEYQNLNDQGRLDLETFIGELETIIRSVRFFVQDKEE